MCKIAGLCKGSTTDSDSVCEGSNPSPAAKIKAAEILGFNGFRRLLFSLTYSSKAYRDSISIWELLYKGWFTPPTALHRLTVHLWQSDNQQRERRRIYNGAHGTLVGGHAPSYSAPRQMGIIIIKCA